MLGDHPPKVYSGASGGPETGMEEPQEDPYLWQCTACVCNGSALLGDLLGVSRTRERDFCLSC